MVFSQFCLVNICQHEVKLIQAHLTRHVLFLRRCTKAFGDRLSEVNLSRPPQLWQWSESCRWRLRRTEWQTMCVETEETELQLQRSGFPLPRNEKGGKATCRRGGKKTICKYCWPRTNANKHSVTRKIQSFCADCIFFSPPLRRLNLPFWIFKIMCCGPWWFLALLTWHRPQVR